MNTVGKPERVTQNRVIALLEQRREKTRTLTQAVMQELLTGSTRLLPPPAAGNLPAKGNP